MAKQMEGDNRARRAKAREARERGHEASEEGVTLGGSKQRREVSDDADHTERLETIHRGKNIHDGEKPAVRPRSRPNRDD